MIRITSNFGRGFRGLQPRPPGKVLRHGVAGIREWRWRTVADRCVDYCGTSGWYVHATSLISITYTIRFDNPAENAKIGVQPRVLTHDQAPKPEKIGEIRR